MKEIMGEKRYVLGVERTLKKKVGVDKKEQLREKMAWD